MSIECPRKKILFWLILLILDQILLPKNQYNSEWQVLYPYNIIIKLPLRFRNWVFSIFWHSFIQKKSCNIWNDTGPILRKKNKIKIILNHRSCQYSFNFWRNTLFSKVVTLPFARKILVMTHKNIPNTFFLLRGLIFFKMILPLPVVTH